MFSRSCWKRDVKYEVFEWTRKLHFCFCFYVAARETEKQKQTMDVKKAPKTLEKRPPIKIVFFKVVIQIWEKWRNGFLAEVAWHYVCQEGRKTRIFVHTICFGQKFFGAQNSEARKNFKITVSAEIAQNLKWHFLGEKGVLGWKWFLLTVFLKSCVFWKHYFIVFSAKHSSCNKKCMLKKTDNLWKVVGCFWTWQKGVFCLFCFRI